MAASARTHHNGKYAPELLARGKMRFERGDPVPEIAGEFGIHPNSLRKVAKKNAWKRPVAAPRGFTSAAKLKQEVEALADNFFASPTRDEDASAHAPRNAATSAADLPSTLDRLERAVLAELATVEAMRAQLGPLPRGSYKAAETARTLATLTQTLQALQRMRAAAHVSFAPGQNHDQDMPADIDEFRRDLARSIDAFVASRTDA